MAALVGLAVFAPAGCEQLPDSESFYEMKVPPENLRQVERLDFEQMKAAENPQPDANETPEEIEVALEDCRALALTNNLDLKVALISPAIAAQQVSEQEARFEAAFFSNATYAKTDTPTETTLKGSQVDGSNVDLGVRVPLRTGGTVTFDLADTRVKTDNIFSTLDPAYTS
ncbi:MAG: hypothetical protein ACYTEX_10830, partial [Planctomycetota bacterium]